MAKKVVDNNDLIIKDMFRQLRANIEFSQMDSALKVINIISTQPGEGKTTVSYNLGKIFADKYRKVLLVDCDLKNPNLHKKAHRKNTKGLSNLLMHYQPGQDITSLEEIQKFNADALNPLYFVSAGERVPNTTEILSSKRFANFIADAKNQFDMVVIDCPPASVFSDAVSLCNLADATLYVVNASETDKFAIKEAITDLDRNGANIIGLIMTKVPEFHERRYAYYGAQRDEEDN